MAKRRFTKATITFLSLCPRGVNRLPVIYKSEDKSLDLDTIVKADEHFDDNGELTAIVYAPEFRDSEGDIASAEVIKDAMYSAARAGLNLDIRHNEKALPKSDAFIAENFLVQKNDPRFAGMKDYHGAAVDVTGAWAVVLKIENATLRKAYRSGEWNGISMGGTAAMDLEKSDDVLARLAKLLNPSLKQDDLNMDKKELTELLAENNKAVLAEVAKMLPAAAKPPEVKPANEAHILQAPVFKGDIADPKAVAAHALLLKKYNLAKAVDWNDEKSVDAYMVELAKVSKAPVEKSDEVKRLETELADAQKRSNQPVREDGATGESEVSKEANLFATGLKMAKAMNEKRFGKAK